MIYNGHLSTLEPSSPAAIGGVGCRVDADETTSGTHPDDRKQLPRDSATDGLRADLIEFRNIADGEKANYGLRV